MWGPKDGIGVRRRLVLRRAARSVLLAAGGFLLALLGHLLPRWIPLRKINCAMSHPSFEIVTQTSSAQNMSNNMSNGRWTMLYMEQKQLDAKHMNIYEHDRVTADTN